VNSKASEESEASLSNQIHQDISRITFLMYFKNRHSWDFIIRKFEFKFILSAGIIILYQADI